MATSTIEKQIDNYLCLLSPAQKETVLSVVKTIVMAQQEYNNLWEIKILPKKWMTELHLMRKDQPNYTNLKI